jgi:hypothetical protein
MAEKFNGYLYIILVHNNNIEFVMALIKIMKMSNTTGFFYKKSFTTSMQVELCDFFISIIIRPSHILFYKLGLSLQLRNESPCQMYPLNKSVK